MSASSVSVSLLPKPSAWSGAFHLTHSAIVRRSQCATSDEFQSIFWAMGSTEQAAKAEAERDCAALLIQGPAFLP